MGLSVVGPCYGVDDDDFQVGRGIVLVGLEDNVYEVLKGGWSVMEDEGKDLVLSVVTGIAECSFLTAFWHEPHLPVAFGEVHFPACQTGCPLRRGGNCQTRQITWHSASGTIGFFNNSISEHAVHFLLYSSTTGL